ncbi:puromycin-sensitive aminopeptidase [Cyclospora cayetanensis]|nr:puromycin-sensitive aminopeptidase [Cyclospora cayetanensis]
MHWDEENAGREYTLEGLHLVGFHGFNIGMTKNKGMFIFDCDSLLADPLESIDMEYASVVQTVSHAYFHSWTNNLMTIKDWSELSHREGLATFREKLFTATLVPPVVTRMQDLRNLLNFQYPEDAGPLAHPIRPESYEVVDNLYTPTVFLKGAEVMRMYHTILGDAGFRKGMLLYQQTYNGKATTSDDFREAMSRANKRQLDQFGLWYSQAGTPEVIVEATSFDPVRHTYSVTVRQRTPPSPGQPVKEWLMIPMNFGLIGKKSKKDILDPPTQLVLLTGEWRTLRYTGITEDCEPSFFRDFSAPVRLIYERTHQQLAFMMAYDSDPINKWRAAQELAMSIILARAAEAVQNPDVKFQQLPSIFVDLMKAMLLNKQTLGAVKAMTLRMPEMLELQDHMRPADPTALHRARRSVIVDLTSALKREMLELYNELTSQEENSALEEVSRRPLRNELLMYLTSHRDREAATRAFEHFASSRCPSDTFYAVYALASMIYPEGHIALNKLYEEAEGNAELINHWFRLQALADMPDQLERVERLLEHPDFSYTNPARLGALFLTLTSWNSMQFHRKDGRGYELLADVVIQVDKHIPKMASRLLIPLTNWTNFVESRQELMKKQLRRILNQPSLSINTKDWASKALAAN